MPSRKSSRRKNQQPDKMVVARERIEKARKEQSIVLDLSGLGLTELPGELGQLGQLAKLRMLILNNNHLTHIPQWVSQLTELQDLYINNNHLTHVPDWIGQLAQLHTLSLYNNQLTHVPEALGQLTQLQRLYLSGNHLTHVPDWIGQLAQLHTLSLYNNQLTHVPEALGQLTQLQRLDLFSNQLTHVPECIGQLTQLRKITLSFNQLTSVPEVLGQLTQLQDLVLSFNQLTSVPEVLGQLTQLEQLSLSGNQLTHVPEWIGQLTQLQELHLANNQLTSVPEWIGQLTQLQELNLSNNQLIGLPESLKKVASLKELYLHGNEQLGLPAEVLGPDQSAVFSNRAQPATPSSILDYYFRTRGGRRPLNEAKLILVGRGGVGKTSLVNRLVRDHFERDERKTEGIQITEWQRLLNGNEQIRLNIWDFGGQEIMHATHQFFLTQRSLYLLVLNGREDREDTDAEYWLKLIESFGGGSPVIVVLNKFKEHPFDLNRNALQRKYPGIRKFVQTDCQEKIGIDELCKAIDRETDRLEHLRDAFPASWFEIKDRLSRMDKNYLGFEEYRAFCQEYGETDQAAQEDLAGYLHQLGIVLNYKDDPRLQDTHVLNPHWVTTGIYKILNSDLLARQKGEIHLNDLAEILDPVEYPRYMRRFIFDLMKKFDLCFTFPNDECHYLVPELLDKQEPDDVAAFEPAACLNFQYHYPILPEGLLPRFIVRTHHRSEQLPRWRTGVILTFEGNKALVRADIQDRKVFISVSGSVAGRRRLLAVIRSEFEQIHRDIRHLQPQEMVPLPEHPDVVVAYRKLQVMEEKGVKEFTEVVGDDVIDLDVQDLLNGVDLEGTRRRERIMDRHAQAIRLFYSYSHKDEALRDELQTHLKLLQRQGLIDSWHDRLIEAGDEWKQRIDDNLERADIILLLISADFIASEYCYEKEMQRALERHEEGTARVIPIIVRKTNWRIAPFRKLQALPKNAEPVTLWPDRDSAWTDVSEGIERVVQELRRKRV
jgi:internalin A